MATLKTIADACGVSIATVSMVLNNKSTGISDKTKQKVIKVAKEQKYYKNVLASGLARGNTDSIGLILPSIENEYFSSLAKEISNELLRYNKTLIICDSNNEIENEQNLIYKLLGYHVDSLILVISSKHNQKSSTNLKTIVENSPKPIIFLDRKPVELDNNINYFICQNRKASYIAGKHLLALGHRKIGYLSGPRNLPNNIERFKGLMEAYQEYGIQYDQSLLFEGDFTIQSGIYSLKYFINNGATAIFSANDMMAYGLSVAARENNIKIPSDLSIIGFDDNIISQICSPPLTTIAQDIKNMCADLTASIINNQNGNSKYPIQKIYTPKLVLRQSTSPPRLKV